MAQELMTPAGRASSPQRTGNHREEGEEVKMRKIVAAEHLTLDGVVQSPEKWSFQYFNDELIGAIGASMASADTMLLGRRTYQEFAAVWPDRGTDEPVAAVMNNTPKLVVSTTLDTVEWQNSTLITGNLVEELTRLKRQPGKNISVVGSPTLVRSLLREGLLDELQLLVYPIVVGTGERLFPDKGEPVPLRLVDATTFGTGVLSLTYAPADR
jgi:dihydrofolate reductase